MNRSHSNQSLILAVDDNEEQLLLISYALMSFNCSFVTALDAQTAFSIAKDHQPALILLDIVMPRENGVELVQKLKQDERTRKIPIIAVTALSRDRDKEWILASGCHDYLTKPYRLNRLRALVERYLNQTYALVSH